MVEAKQMEIGEAMKTGIATIINAFYDMQKYRVAIGNAITAYSKDGRPVPPYLARAYDVFLTNEDIVLKAIIGEVEHLPEYGWLISLKGVGERLAAQVVALFPWQAFNSPGQLWSYSGLNPNNQQRFSRKHKALAYRLVMSQLMSKGDYYPLYLARKDYEWRRNLAGELEDQAKPKYSDGTTSALWVGGRINPEWARAILADGLSFPQTINEKTEYKGIKALGQGPKMLPPAHIDARAKRWLAKLMLDHYWQVAKWYHTGERHVPYAIAHMNHMDRIEPINAPWNAVS